MEKKEDGGGGWGQGGGLTVAMTDPSLSIPQLYLLVCQVAVIVGSGSGLCCCTSVFLDGLEQCDVCRSNI